MTTYYTSFTGMLAASYALQTTSNNVAHMQSPGFRRSDVFYSSLSDGQSHDGLGAGVSIAGTHTNFAAGTYLETQNPSDLAVVGPGFFIVRLKNGELLYTRDGEFGFNNDGMLADKHSGGLVQGYDKQGNLVPIHQFGPKVHTGKTTRYVELAGQLILVEKKKNDSPAPPDPGLGKSKYENISFNVEDIFDEKGKAHKIGLEFKPVDSINEQINPDGSQWELVRLTCDGEEISFSPQTLQFNLGINSSEAAPEEGYNIINFNLKNKQSVTLKFGSYFSDSDKSVRLKKSDTNLYTKITTYKKDGYGEGKQIDFTFDENGQISYNYDNGQSIEGIHVALAKFDNEQTLQQANDNLFRTKSNYGRHIGRANKEGFGSLQPKKLESANVDSTMEFANIVVLQRMFQACSQIMDIDKQLLDDLYKK